MEAFIQALIANALAAIVLVLLAFAVSVFRRDRATHTAWFVVLIKLMTPPLVVIPALWIAARAEVKTESKPTISPTPISLVEPIPAAMEIPFTTTDQESENLSREILQPIAEPPSAEESVISTPQAAPINIWRTLFVVWVSGTIAWLCVVSLRVHRFRRYVKMALPVNEATQQLGQDISKQMGLKRSPQISFINEAMSPMLWAIAGRPEILLPKKLWDQFTIQQREAVLAHELAHLARGDHWMRRFELIVLAVYWWCPMAWLAVRELRRAEEVCCDERVLRAVPERAEAYAEALVETIAYVNQPRWIPLTSGGIARVSDLRRRVTMIMESKVGSRATSWLIAGVVLIGFAVMPLAPGLADETQTVPTTEAQEIALVPQANVQLRLNNASDMKLALTDHVVTAVPVSNVQLVPSNQSLSDELELLEAQKDVKMALVTAAERNLKTTDLTISRLSKLAEQGAISAEQVVAAQEAHNKALSEIEIRKAELKEHMVRIAQVKRRMNQGVNTAPMTARIPAHDTMIPPLPSSDIAPKSASRSTASTRSTTPPSLDPMIAPPATMTPVPVPSRNALPAPTTSTPTARVTLPAANAPAATPARIQDATATARDHDRIATLDLQKKDVDLKLERRRVDAQIEMQIDTIRKQIDQTNAQIKMMQDQQAQLNRLLEAVIKERGQSTDAVKPAPVRP